MQLTGSGQSLYHIKTMKNKPIPSFNNQPPVPIGLSPRERQVMEHLAEGLLYKEIADRMKISYAAVHKLQHKIFVKLRVGNRTEAVVKWTSLVLISVIRTGDKVAADGKRRASS